MTEAFGDACVNDAVGIARSDVVDELDRRSS